MTSNFMELAQAKGIDLVTRSWEPLRSYLADERDKLVANLIAREDPLVRGRIQQLDQILALPAEAERVMSYQRSPLPSSGGL